MKDMKDMKDMKVERKATPFPKLTLALDETRVKVPLNTNAQELERILAFARLARGFFNLREIGQTARGRILLDDDGHFICRLVSGDRKARRRRILLHVKEFR